jgi:hypothetical protein
MYKQLPGGPGSFPAVERLALFCPLSSSEFKPEPMPVFPSDSAPCPADFSAPSVSVMTFSTSSLPAPLVAWAPWAFSLSSTALKPERKRFFGKSSHGSWPLEASAKRAAGIPNFFSVSALTPPPASGPFPRKGPEGGGRAPW